MPLWTMQSRSFLALPLCTLDQSDIRLCAPYLTILLLLLLAGIIVFPAKGLMKWSMLSVLAILVGMDLHRLQVWVWFYFLWFLCFDQLDLKGFRYLAGAMYLWTGLNKINLHFFQEVCPELLEGFGLTGDMLAICLGIVSISVEIVIGFSLLIGLRKKWLLYAIIFLHAGILCILVFGLAWNWVVIPWNLALPVAAWLLLKDEEKSDQFSGVNQQAASVGGNELVLEESREEKFAVGLNLKMLIPEKRGFGLYGGIGLAIIAPVFHFFGWWPYALSWMMYSGLQPEITYAYTPLASRPCPQDVKNLVFEIDGEGFIALQDWTFAECSVPPYVSQAAFARMSADWCALGCGKNRYSYWLTAHRFAIKTEQLVKQKCPESDPNRDLSQSECCGCFDCY
jgi:hypothetical protein